MSRALPFQFSCLLVCVVPRLTLEGGRNSANKDGNGETWGKVTVGGIGRVGIEVGTVWAKMKAEETRKDDCGWNNESWKRETKV